MCQSAFFFSKIYFHHPWFWLEKVAPWCWATRQSIVGWMFAIANYEASAPTVWLPAENGGFLTRGPSGFLEISRFTLCSGGTVPWNSHLSRHQNLICNMNHNIHARSFLQRKQNPPFLCLPTKSSFPLITNFQHHTSTSDIAKPISLYKFNIHPPRTFFAPTPRKFPLQTPTWLRAAVGGPRGTDNSAWSKLHKLLVPSAPRRTVNDSNLFVFWEYGWKGTPFVEGSGFLHIEILHMKSFYYLIISSIYVSYRYSKLIPETGKDLRVVGSGLSAMPAQHMKAPKQAQEDTSPAKIDVTSKSPVGDISVVTLIRTDTTLDHSQKAEKVWDERLKGWERAVGAVKTSRFNPRKGFSLNGYMAVTPSQIPVASSKKRYNLEMQKVTCIFISSNLESNNPS